MRKLFLSVGCALILLATATVSDAKIFVNISDGTTTLDAGSATVPFIKSHVSNPTHRRLSQRSDAPTGTLDATATLTCSSVRRGRARSSSPAARLTQQPGDTFKLQDVGSTTSLQARLEKFDSGSSADRVSFKGVKFTSIGALKTLTVTYGNQAGDLRALTSSQATSYNVTAAMSGSFKTSLGARASSCKAGTTRPTWTILRQALRLSIGLNGTATNGQLGNTATVSVPCNSTFTVNPCGGGTWTPSNGTFTGVNDSNSISCPSSCSPAQVATLVAKFNAANEVLQMTASTHGAIANVSDENGGVEERLSPSRPSSDCPAG